jgi:ectoine hydroxylase-related dioxygenase (phytanoyl-CoA dioxygenase family)
MNDSTELRKQVEAQGYAIVPAVVDANEIATLVKDLEAVAEGPGVRRRGGVFAVRNLLNVSPAVAELAASEKIRRLVEAVLRSRAIPVRGILFDKTADANWKVPWHQDVTIAVSREVDAEGFGPWSVKAGIVHVQPPAWVLENMISIRLHLDDCGEENGALRVVPGSHRLGKLTENQAASVGAEGPPAICNANAGDALIMRPLLVHASSSCVVPKHRRVVHIDFAAADLPNGMEWYEEEAGACHY